MVVKIGSLIVSNRISKWVFSMKFLSSISRVANAQVYPKTNQFKGLIRTEIDPRVQYLKKDLCPENLIKVLDSTNDLNSALKVFKWASLQKEFKHTINTYYWIIIKLGFVGNVDEMEGFCREMVKDRCQGVEEMFNSLVDVFVGNGRLDEVIRVILVMNSSGYRPSIGKWNVVLGALVEGKREFHDVLLVYKEMVKSGTLPSVDTLNFLIKGLFDGNMVDYAVDQFRKMKNKGCVPNCRTFEIVIHGLVIANLGSEALGVMNEMFESGVIPDLGFYTSVIPLLCRKDKPGQAMRLFNMMRASGYVADFCIYSSLIKCLCMNLCRREATELFHEMRNVGINPSTDVLVDILTACCKLRKFDEAINLLGISQVIDPSPYNVLLQGYCDAHCFLAAMDLFQRMLHLDVVDHLSWNILIQGLCAMNYVKQAYQILGKMITLSYVLDSSIYSSFVVGKCNLSHYDDALELFRQVSEKDWVLSPYSYEKLIGGLCDVEKFQEASEVFIYMSTRDCGLEPSSFNSLIKGFCGTEKVDEAIRLLNFGHYYKNPVNTNTYTTVICYLLRQSKPYEGLAFLSQILRRGLVLDVVAYNIVIQCLIASHETNCCVMLLKEMVRENSLPYCETLASLLPHLVNNSELQIVWRSIIKCCLENKVTDPKIYNLLINGLCKVGCKPEACELLDMMLERGWVPDTSTHGWLIGSVSSQEADLQILETDMKDEVSSILSEGLGQG